MQFAKIKGKINRNKTIGLDADIYGYTIEHVRQRESTRCLRVFAFSPPPQHPECACKLPFFLDIVLVFGFFNSPTFSSNNVWSLT